MPTLEDFLRRALPWPDPNSETGWVNLHWRASGKDRVTGGQAFKTLEDTLSFIRWSQTRGKGKIADLYFCTSLQEQCGDLKPNGNHAALRSIDNAVSSKILYADIDKYPTKVESFGAVEKFCHDSKSPFPTALIDSGGGCHAYWFLPQALPREEWLELAHKFDGLMNAYGLKHDNISTDMARILRPPETRNYKRVDTGDPVVLHMLNGDVDLGAWKSLHEATPTTALTRSTKKFNVSLEKLFVYPDLMRGQKPDPAFAESIPLEEEIGGTVDPAPVLKLCPMFAETLATGGKGVGQPVWHQQALACTFLAGGYEIFHDLGRQHSGYSRESSDGMFYRKAHDRAAKGLGYPSCAAFEADGASQCRACPWRGKVRSPLNLPVEEKAKPEEAAATETVVQTIEPSQEVTLRDGLPAEKLQYPTPSGIQLPKGYDVDSEGFIILLPPGKGKKGDSERLFESKILGWKAFTDPVGRAMGLRLQVTGPLEESYPLTIPSVAFGSGQGIYDALNQGGCNVLGNPPAVMKLMSTMRGRIAREQGAARNVPFGWEYKDRGEDVVTQGEPIGFAYGGKVYSADGTVRDTYGGAPHLLETYCVSGSADPWIQAVRVIQRMDSPGLAAVVLSAFAAPLMIFSGQPSTVVMVRGQSGGSKSTASSVATAVWARPRTAMLKPSSSKLGVMKRMGHIRHLPTIWDDIRNEQFEFVKDTLMEITQGGEGVKLDANRDEREQGIWDNMLLTSSNNSLVEYLEEISKNDGAALVRCFEFEVPKVRAEDASYQDPNKVSPLIASLDHNHGHIGREYAAVLGFAVTAIKNDYKILSDRLSKRVEPYQPHERFWMAAMTTILLGGQIANQLPTIKANAAFFNLHEVEEFLIKTFLELRGRHANANFHADTSSYTRIWVSHFINQYAAPHNEQVWTFDGPTGRGRPETHPPIWPIGDQARNMKKVSVRWQRDDRKVKISKAALDKYLRQEKVSVDRIKQGLLQFYDAKLVHRQRIAAGLANVGAQAPEIVYEIDVKPGTWMDDLWLQHARDGDPQNIGPPPRGQTPDQSETRPPPEREDPEGEKAAS